MPKDKGIVVGISNSKSIIFIILIIILGFIFRSYNLSKYGFWNDERVTICIANGLIINEPLKNNVFTNFEIYSQNTNKNVLRATIADNGHSIFYNVILHYWTKLLGNSDFIARSLSVIFGILLILLSYVFARKIFFDKRIGILTALLFAIQPLFIADAHEAQAYSIATFLSFLSSFLFYLIITNKKQIVVLYISYIITVVASLLSHYLTSYIFISHIIIFILFVKDKNIWINYILSGVVICVLFSIWMFVGGYEGIKVLNDQFSRMAEIAAKYKEGDNPYIMPISIKNIFTGWIQVWLQIFGNSLQNFGFKIRVIAILIIIPFLSIGYTFFNKKEKEDKKKMIFLIILTVTQVLYATITSLREGHCRSFQSQYAVFASPYAIMLLAYSIYYIFFINKMKKIRVLLSVIVVTIMVISNYPTYADIHGEMPPRPFNPYFLSAKQINRNYKKGDTVFINNLVDAKLINLYVRDDIEIFQKIDTAIGIKINMPR